MYQSKLFYKSLRENPKDAKSISHALLIRAGFIDQLGAGIFTFLPLGLRVIKNIENIIREEMIKVGGQEVLMPALIPKENLKKTGRWESLDILYKLEEHALGATHEEVVSPLAKKVILSYKDLPLYLFQIQTKFRNELRAKSGLLRTREFLMKDLYSFHSDENDLDKYYEKVTKSYISIFKKCKVPFLKTLASGGSFSKFSHEFQAITEAGEDIIYVCDKCGIAINKEIKSDKCPDCGGVNFKEEKAVEIGNIFKLKDKYSLPFELNFKDKDGKEKPVLMGCYGIGLGRLMATAVEINHDDRGIIWPKEISPFDIHLICLGNNKAKCEKIYKELISKGKEVLYDDRDNSTGEKFAEADLIGIPVRMVISDKTLKSNSIEVKNRNSNKTCLIKFSRIFRII
jgi:prolyl-tRNA synthetase